MFLDLAREAPVGASRPGWESSAGSLEGQVARCRRADIGRALHEGRELLREGRVYSR